MSDIPKGVQRILDSLEMSEQELREYIQVQYAAFDRIADKPTDFTGWVQYKLSASRPDTVTALHWAGNPKRRSSPS